MYAIYGNIYHQYTPNVSIYTIHGYTWILWVMNGGLFVCILCILMIPSLDVSIPCVEKGCFRKLGTVPQQLDGFLSWKIPNKNGLPDGTTILGIYVYIHTYIWANYNDLTATSLEQWLVREIIPKWPYFRSVNYNNLPRYIYIYIYTFIGLQFH